MVLIKNKWFKWVLLITFILLIPFIAMFFTAEVDWSAADFIIMGALLSFIAVAYEFISSRQNSKIYRIAFFLAVLAALALFIFNAAVGIIGSEGQSANLWFAAVFVTGIGGAFVSGFRAKGMSVTLFITAIVQMIIPVIAYLVYPPPVISWSPGVFQVFMFCALFALMFGVSGLLFRKAIQ